MPTLIVTADGSHSLMMDDKEESYHSRHGALTESLHVFIETGLKYLPQKNVGEIRILEVGFGTGLNCLLTYRETKGKVPVYYVALEPFPLKAEIYEKLNYPELIGEGYREILLKMHLVEAGEEVALSDRFILQKVKTGLKEFRTDKKFDLVYFDAFAPQHEPLLWTEEVFRHVYDLMNAGGILVTYCAKGDVRRAMKAAGFKVEKLVGPPGKREMTRGER